MLEYTKPPKSLNEQINLLKDRGLLIKDEETATRYLENISYYHFSIYFKHFQNKDNKFLKDTTFDDVLNVYIFDQKLRLLLLDILERIEKSFKARFIYQLSIDTENSHRLLSTECFQDADSQMTVDFLIKEISDSKEVFIKKYSNTYSKPDQPPIWMIIEILTFGKAIHLYRKLSKYNKRLISDTYGLHPKFIESWMYALSDLRNLCAHHSRVWNKDMRVTPTDRHKIYGKLFNHSNGNRLFNYILIMHIFNYAFNPHSTWLDRLDDLMQEHTIEISHMGFPNDWKERILKIIDKT